VAEETTNNDLGDQTQETTNSTSEGDAAAESLLSQQKETKDATKDAENAKDTTKDTKDTAKETEPPLTSKDFTLPDGSVWDDSAGNGFLDIVNDSSLSRKELAEKLVNIYLAQHGKILEGIKAAEDEQVKLLDKQTHEWLESCKKDPEFGGQKYEESKAIIDRGSNRLATKGAIDILNQCKLGTHPEIVRMFYRAGLLLGEDSAAGSGKNAPKKDDLADAIFGDSVKDL